MSLSYTLRESVSGFRRTKLSSLLSIITIAISLLLLGVFAVLTIHATRFLDEVRARVELEVFLEEPITRHTIDSLRTVITEFDGVGALTYVSKAEAAAIFKKEFGEDILSVLDFNPLPPSFKVGLAEGYRTATHAERLERRLSTLTGVESVKYRKEFLEIIDERARIVHNVSLGLGVLVGLSAIVLVSNTIRMAISAKRQIIRTMELVGATRTFIRMPFLLEGIMQGLLGGVMAAGILYVLLAYAVRVISPDLPGLLRIEPVYYVSVVIAGGVLGWIGSSISVLRFIRPQGR
jgi:cell division transport system permease protein